MPFGRILRVRVGVEPRKFGRLVHYREQARIRHHLHGVVLSGDRVTEGALEIDANGGQAISRLTGSDYFQLLFRR
jgi:hypothetical protein